MVRDRQHEIAVTRRTIRTGACLALLVAMDAAVACSGAERAAPPPRQVRPAVAPSRRVPLGEARPGAREASRPAEVVVARPARQRAVSAPRGPAPIGRNLAACKSMQSVTKAQWKAQGFRSPEEVPSAILESIRKGRPQDIVRLLPLYLRASRCAKPLPLPAESISALCDKAAKLIKECWRLIERKSLKLITGTGGVVQTRLCGGQVVGFSPAVGYFNSGRIKLLMEFRVIGAHGFMGISSIPVCRQFHGTVVRKKP